MAPTTTPAPAVDDSKTPPTVSIALGIVLALAIALVIYNGRRLHASARSLETLQRRRHARSATHRFLDRATLEKFPIIKYEPELAKRHGSVTGDMRLCAAHLISSRAGKASLVTNAKPDGYTGNDESVLDNLNRGNVPQLKPTITPLRQARFWASLRKTALAEPDSRSERPACVICADDFVEGVDVRRLPCLHIFHPLCIDTWLLEWSGTCPLCRTDLHPPSEDIMPQAPPHVAVLSNRRI
ncbi:hypothetical protein GQ53DRAFT_179995 [Thozetella sp. PMI_491]|nr:hypothetical protein GQ53DRAFT_179995 [Thozetella sp. PMI_491]